MKADLQVTNPELVQERRRILLGPDPAIVITSCEVLTAPYLRSAVHKVKGRNYCHGARTGQANSGPMFREVAAGLPNTRLTILEGLPHVPICGLRGSFCTQRFHFFYRH